MIYLINIKTNQFISVYNLSIKEYTNDNINKLYILPYLTKSNMCRHYQIDLLCNTNPSKIIDENVHFKSQNLILYDYNKNYFYLLEDSYIMDFSNIFVLSDKQDEYQLGIKFNSYCTYLKEGYIDFFKLIDRYQKMKNLLKFKT